MSFMGEKKIFRKEDDVSFGPTFLFLSNCRSVSNFDLNISLIFLKWHEMGYTGYIASNLLETFFPKFYLVHFHEMQFTGLAVKLG